MEGLVVVEKDVAEIVKAEKNTGQKDAEKNNGDSPEKRFFADAAQPHARIPLALSTSEKNFVKPGLFPVGHSTDSRPRSVPGLPKD
jgi:hypothetical protein